MTDTQVEKVAELLESTWPKAYYMKNHQSLVSSIYTMMADCKLQDVVEILRDYACNYDNAPTVATISKLAHQGKQSTPEILRAKYFEDADGCGYLYNDKQRDYECIWKYWWPGIRGLTKMEVLKNYGLVNY